MSCLRWCRPATSLPFCNMSPVFRLWIRRVHFAKRRCDRRNSLHQHISVVHAKHWRNASSLAATLNSRFQKLQHCYCRPVLQCKGKPHVCIVFKQYSLLRTVRFLDADNTALILFKIVRYLLRTMSPRTFMNLKQTPQRTQAFLLKNMMIHKMYQMKCCSTACSR